MGRGALFLTGASGFVGGRVLRALAGRGREVRALVRGGEARLAGTGATAVEGDLVRPESYSAALSGCELVLHVAAVTGRAPAREHLRVNAEGTEWLLAACRAAGVRRVVHVSTVAVRYAGPAYPYARSKALAEEAVVASGVPYVIVRPSIVLGREAAAWRSLSALARLPLVPLPGGGRVRIQPIDGDDLARALCELVDDVSLDGGAYELGGRDALSFADFLRRAHRALRGGEARAFRVPVRPVAAVLAVWERLGLPLPPVTSGQLQAFLHDSDVRVNALQRREEPRLTALEAMLARYTAHG